MGWPRFAHLFYCISKPLFQERDLIDLVGSAEQYGTGSKLIVFNEVDYFRITQILLYLDYTCSQLQEETIHFNGLDIPPVTRYYVISDFPINNWHAVKNISISF